jgi:hypothetical protein
MSDQDELTPEAETRADAIADAEDAIANGEDPTSAEYSVAFTPRNVAVGLAIVAGVVAFALSRRRRGGDRDRAG